MSGVAIAAGGLPSADTAKKKTPALTKKQVNKLIASYFKKNRSKLVGKTGATGAAGAAGAAGASVKGDKGDAGDTSVTTFKTSIQAPGTLATPAETTLVSVSGISIVGKCYTDAGTTYAKVFARSATANTALSDYGTAGENQTVDADDAGHTNDVEIEYPSSTNDPTVRDFEGPYDGTFAVATPDFSTYYTGSATTGVFLNGASSAACSFGGFITVS